MSNKLIKGTIVVTIASLFVKVLSIIYKIPYQNLTGDKGFYIYQQLYPIYALIVSISTFAIPLSISEYLSREKNLNVYSSVFYPLMGLSLLLSTLLLVFNKEFGLVFNDINLSLLFYPLIPVLLFFPLLSILKGYNYSNIQTIKRIGIASVIEQILRVGLTIFILYLFSSTIYVNDIYQVAFYSYWGFGLGLLISCLYLIKGFKRNYLRLESTDLQLSYTVIKRASFLLVSSSALLLFQLIDSLTIINQLSSKINTDEAMRLKGIYDRSFPLIQTAVFFVSPIITSMIPHLGSEQRRAKVINIIFFLAFPATLGIMFIANDLNSILFMDNSHTDVIRINLLLIILYSLLLTFSAILNSNKMVIYITFFGLVIKFVLNLTLIKGLGIAGAAIGSVLALFLINLLIVIVFRKRLFLNKVVLIKILFSGFMMLLFLFGVSEIIGINNMIVIVFIGLISYLLFSLLVRLKVTDFINK